MIFSSLDFHIAKKGFAVFLLIVADIWDETLEALRASSYSNDPRRVVTRIAEYVEHDEYYHGAQSN